VAAAAPFQPKFLVMEVGSQSESGISKNYFEMFNLPVKYFIDQNQLRSQYYALSLRLHPDKFQSDSPHVTEDFSHINEAYETLKSDALRAEYILDLAKVLKIEKKKLPLDLAEQYFDLQDFLSEEATKEEIEKKIQDFSNLIDLEMNRSKDLVQSCFKAWELKGALLTQATDSALVSGSGSESGSALSTIAEQLATQSYLVSMKKDLEKKCQK
jgi:molecular chaperone HscB